jgi:Acyl-protein synthetase, LuxE
MADAEIDVLPLLRQLLVFARKWSHGLPLDFDAVAQVRNRVLTLNHQHHLREIPIFAQLARERDVADRDPLELARDRLVLSDDWFKSYNPEWLHGDFASLSAWLETVSTVRLPRCSHRASDLSSWRSELLQHGVFVTLSSGTLTGQPSLVPRDESTLAALRSSSGVRFPWSIRAGEYDCVLLTAAGMDSGLQAGAAGLASNACRVHHLHTPGLYEFLCAAAARRQPVIIFGSPSGLASLIDEMARKSRPVELPAASCVVTGGGWKDGPAQDLDSLLDAASTLLGIDRRRCVDAYSTAELNTVFVSCANHRYHVPPVVEAVLVDDLLRPLHVDAHAGRLAVFDPFARSYPSLATSDHVILRADPCACGLAGQTLLAPITRLENAPPRGCGALGVGEPDYR